ncbi:LysM peptidoglycan-binding domain-containing protein [Alicyclobacillus sendaiensis]|uniref:LysM peptidoglycan-binding domain-containing protein n=1 Tax=Alicyclobacillus sendaiensis TaxID=192387 RepID=UPI0026F43F01|nr:LysM domain-containing protein [Alicyclobacillus sendaiensis]
MPVNWDGVIDITVGPAGGTATNTLVLPVNPDSTLSQDTRVTVTQTLNGLYFDDFGLGIPTVQLQGNTAYRSSQGKFNGHWVDGNTAAQHLYRDIIKYYFDQEQAGKPMVMYIYDHAFGRAWQVKPMEQLQLSITSQNPLVINYSCTFTVIQDLIIAVNVPKISDPVKAIWQTTTSIKRQVKSNAQTAASRASSASQKKPMVYVVKAGDTLWSIAQMYLPSNATNAQIQAYVNKIAATNRISNVNLIFPGEQLKIPAA